MFIILCFISDVVKDSSHMMKDTVEKIKKIIGKARNYGKKLIIFASAVSYRNQKLIHIYMSLVIKTSLISNMALLLSYLS
jgi:GH25 family lysozyme M1 (1,4-beta-N-acetylmuramidase)